MDTLSIWYSELGTVDKFYWGIAIFFSVIFLVQTILTFIGIDSFDSDADVSLGGAHLDAANGADFDGHTLGAMGVSQLFSIRTLIYFMLGMSWGAISVGGLIENEILRGIVALICGCVFVGVFYAIMRTMLRLQTSGNVSIEQSIGLTAQVYLRIGAGRSQKGKVSVSIGGALREYDALTDGTELKSGSQVRITAVEGSTLIVESTQQDMSNIK